MTIHRIPWSAMERLDGLRGGRFYRTPNGEVCPSVTNILSVIAKPALVNWAAKVEREMVIEAAANLYLDLPPDPRAPRMKRDAFIRTLEQRIGVEKAHQKVAKKATDIGGQCHELIEWNLRRELGQEAGPEPKIEPAAAIAFAAFHGWWRGSGLKPARVEQMIYHPQELYAGTADLLATGPDGELVLVDFKTSKAIYLEYLLQVAAYAEAINAMGHGPIRRGLIVRFPKTETEADFNPIRDIQAVEKIDQLFQVFKNVMALWKWLQDNDTYKKTPTAAPEKPPQAAVEPVSPAVGNGAAEAAGSAGEGTDPLAAGPQWKSVTLRWQEVDGQDEEKILAPAKPAKRRAK